jgi:hypothetical protein
MDKDLVVVFVAATILGAILGSGFSYLVVQSTLQSLQNQITQIETLNDDLQSQVNSLQTSIDVLEERIQSFSVEVRVKDIRNTIESDMSNLIVIGEIVAALPEVRSGDWQSMIDTLIIYESRLVSGSFIWFCYPNGTYYTTTQGLINKTLSDRPYFPVAIGGKVSVGTTVYSRSSGLAVHVTAVPVFNGTDVVGILGISTPLQEWSESIATRLGIALPNFFFVLSEDGWTQMHQKNGMILTTNPITGEGIDTTISYMSLKEFLEEALVTKEGTGIYEYDDVTGVCGYTTITNLQWTVFYVESG